MCRPHGGRQGGGRHPDRMQTTSYFAPHALAHGARARGCFTCTHFLARFYAEHLLCERNRGRQVIGQPLAGCAFWMREPGSDDD